MLSQIENGTAKPSMKTLSFLAGRLGKSVSYFLEETAVVSPNQNLMESARELYDAKDYSAAAQVLEGYRGPDAVYDREQQLMWALIRLELAEEAIRQGREIYALELLEKAEAETAYCTEELRRRRLLLRGRIKGQRVSHQLPCLDEELLLRAGEALSDGQPELVVRLLEAAQNRETPQWCMLRGETYLAQRDYRNAAKYFHGAEAEYPMKAAARLEECYRELEDYRKAYVYACKQRKVW
jgi:transcriptional regulator with XRE-family HTH domain